MNRTILSRAGIVLLAVALLSFICLLAGCSTPKQFKAPDAKPLLDAQKAAEASVTQARTKTASATKHLDTAQEHHDKAIVSHSKETVLLGEIIPNVAKLRTSVTDVALRAEVDAIYEQVEQTNTLAKDTDAEIAAEGAELAATKNDLSGEGGAVPALKAADDRLKDVTEKFGPQYVKQVEDVVKNANTEVLKAAAGEATAKEHTVIAWSCAVLIGIGFAAFAYLKR